MNRFGPASAMMASTDMMRVRDGFMRDWSVT